MLSFSRPIKPGIGGQKQTFEELLEEQLRLEEQRLKSARKQQVRKKAKGLRTVNSELQIISLVLLCDRQPNSHSAFFTLTESK